MKSRQIANKRKVQTGKGYTCKICKSTMDISGCKVCHGDIHYK